MAGIAHMLRSGQRRGSGWPRRLVAWDAVRSKVAGVSARIRSHPNLPLTVRTSRSLSFTGNMTSMHVSWVTVGSTKTSTAVKYGTSKSSLTKTANASSYTYTSGMTTPITIMDADMTGLEANTKYYYAVGDSDTVYNFTAAPTRSGGNVYAVLADFGVVNDVSLKQLITEAQHDLFDAVIHAGDFGAFGKGIGA
jgi:hypothetical protein